MASAQVNHEEEYAKIMSNLANIKNVWGPSSRQYAEADEMAAEYLRTFLGPGKTSKKAVKTAGILTAAPTSHVPADGRTLNLVFRPKVAP